MDQADHENVMQMMAARHMPAHFIRYFLDNPSVAPDTVRAVAESALCVKEAATVSTALDVLEAVGRDPTRLPLSIILNTMPENMIGDLVTDDAEYALVGWMLDHHEGGPRSDHDMVELVRIVRNCDSPRAQALLQWFFEYVPELGQLVAVGADRATRATITDVCRLASSLLPDQYDRVAMEAVHAIAPDSAMETTYRRLYGFWVQLHRCELTDLYDVATEMTPQDAAEAVAYFLGDEDPATLALVQRVVTAATVEDSPLALPALARLAKQSLRQGEIDLLMRQVLGSNPDLLLVFRVAAGFHPPLATAALKEAVSTLKAQGFDPDALLQDVKFAAPRLRARAVDRLIAEYRRSPNAIAKGGLHF